MRVRPPGGNRLRSSSSRRSLCGSHRSKTTGTDILTVYVDGQGLLRSVTVTTQATVGSSGPYTMAFTETFSGYGSTVADISAPPATEVATLQQVAQAGGSGAATSGSDGTATTT